MTKFICEKCGREVEIKNYKDNVCFVCKRKESMKKKYGVENPFQLDYVKNKIKKTLNEKYGVDNPGQIVENKEKKEKRRKETNLKRYGNENVLSLNEIQEKIKKTNIKKYGHNRAIQSEEYKQKMYNTNIKKYGHKVPSQNKEIQEKMKTSVKKTLVDRGNNKKKIFIKQLLCNIDNVVPLFSEDDYKGISYNNKYLWKCKVCNHEFLDVLYAGHRPICPSCFPKLSGYSNLEKEIVTWLESFNIKVIENTRALISPSELDIYLPNYNIAIEFDGLYWHSDIYKDKNYHLNKTIECEKQGIQLIHIFENEWIQKQEIVKARLKNILGLNENRIGARKTIIKEINAKTKNIFLNQYHIQGVDKSSIKLGAYYNDELVGIMTFSKPRIALGSKSKEGKWELSRFATISNTYTPGLASKMLKYFERNYKWKEIYSYADRRWSQGKLYNKLDFFEKEFTGINYWYWDGKNLSHRYKYRKDQLKNFDNYDNNKTEKEIMNEAGYLRIYDCGNYKFIKNNLSSSRTR